MSRGIKYTAAGVGALVVLGGAATAVFHFYPMAGSGTASATPSFAEEVAAAEQANSAGLSAAAGEAASEAAAASFAHTYINRALGFSFGYPDGFTVGESTDPPSAGGATTIIVQNTGEHVGFQIYIRSWQGGAITAGDIAQNLPQIAMQNPEPVSLDGASGLAFNATDPNFGKSLQVWFTHGGELYQISTYANQGPLLSKVLGTWKWGN